MCGVKRAAYALADPSSRVSQSVPEARGTRQPPFDATGKRNTLSTSSVCPHTFKGPIRKDKSREGQFWAAAAKRKRERRLRAWPRHECLSAYMVVAEEKGGEALDEESFSLPSRVKRKRPPCRKCRQCSRVMLRREKKRPSMGQFSLLSREKQMHRSSWCKQRPLH